MALFFSRTEVQNLDKDSLFELMSLKMPEGSQIDYKENLSGDSKNEAYKEFLKDVTAFANAHGGVLLLGVKEPSENLSAENQIVGINDGDNLAKDLERLAANSTDPRIPGLIVQPVQITQNKYVIVVFIPASLIRPHMVSYRKHRSFYIRHSESSVPMTTHEIRDTVLNSITTEDRARNYAIAEENEALEYIIDMKPAFLLQAMPLLPLVSPWDVLSEAIERIVRGEGRNNKYKYDQFSLQSSIRPTPILKGVMGRESRDNEHWVTEIHRSGFIQAIYMDIQPALDDANIFILHDGYAELFEAFCDLTESFWKETRTDIPYMFRLKYFNAEQTKFLSSDSPKKFTPTYGRRVIVWPEQFRQVGEPLEGIYSTWTEMLFHAFGLNWKLPQHKKN
jgi:hypothetical protein